MRVTTKVIQNNTLSNINQNKVLQDKLSNQMATEKKINRPSEDPVVAIRALRLRTNVSQVSQYYEKNIPDAKSWMKITEDALTSVSSVLTDMIEQCTKGSSEKLTSSDRQTILDAMSSLRDEVYATGNSDYAGRYVFTGYRTDTSLKYTQSEDKEFEITEQLQNTSVDTIKYIDEQGLSKITDVNFNAAPQSTIQEGGVQEHEIYRIRLAYKNIDEGVAPVIESADGSIHATATVRSENESPSPYLDALDDDACILIRETGEILIGKNLYKDIMDLKDDVTTTTLDEGELRITYNKTKWAKEDLRPEHYFACKDVADGIAYNADYLAGSDREKQSIEYDVGINQSIKVNTTADEVFTHSIGRDVDDIIAAMKSVTDMEAKISQLEELAVTHADDNSTGNLDIINDQLAAANKALTYLKEKCQGLFESGITKFQQHLDHVNYATTSCGTREKKLELIENRLMSQKSSFEELQSENENVDITDVAIQLSSAELAYQASLMATSKILQTNLASYI